VYLGLLDMKGRLETWLSNQSMHCHTSGLISPNDG